MQFAYVIAPGVTGGEEIDLVGCADGVEVDVVAETLRVALRVEGYILGFGYVFISERLLKVKLGGVLRGC